MTIGRTLLGRFEKGEGEEGGRRKESRKTVNKELVNNFSETRSSSLTLQFILQYFSLRGTPVLRIDQNRGDIEVTDRVTGWVYPRIS